VGEARCISAMLFYGIALAPHQICDEAFLAGRVLPSRPDRIVRRPAVGRMGSWIAAVGRDRRQHKGKDCWYQKPVILNS